MKCLVNIVTLLPELRSGDHEFYFRYLRKNPERFDQLLSLLKDKIARENTRFRKNISAEGRLMLTLTFLATGISQQRLSFAFRIGKSAVEKSLAETCQAIYDSLKGTYLRASATPNDWLHISKQF